VENEKEREDRSDPMVSYGKIGWFKRKEFF